MPEIFMLVPHCHTGVHRYSRAAKPAQAAACYFMNKTAMEGDNFDDFFRLKKEFHIKSNCDEL